MLKQFTKTICHYPLAEKKINSKPLTHHSHSHSHMLLYFPCLIFHLFVLCYILGLFYRVALTLEKKSYRKKLYFFILTYWNWNKSFFSSGYASESHIVYVFWMNILMMLFFVFLLWKGKLNDDLNVNNNKWGGGSNALLQNSNNNSHHQLLNNNNNKQTNLGSGLSNHQHHHHALSAAALSSPFSSLLSAGSSAGYLLDPLGGFSKPATANHLF